MPDSEGSSARLLGARNYFPNFQDLAIFPPFLELPLADSSNPSAPFNSQSSNDYYLLATIHENMTLSTTPTYICKDRDQREFAIKFVPGGGAKLDTKVMRKEHTIVVKNAKRSGVKDGKQGFVQIDGTAFDVSGATEFSWIRWNWDFWPLNRVDVLNRSSQPLSKKYPLSVNCCVSKRGQRL